MNSFTSLPFTHRRWFWDTLIIIILCVCIAIIIVGYTDENLTRKVVWVSMGTLGFFLTFYGSFIEPKRLKMNTKIIHNETLPQCTIAIASDFHLGPYNNHILLERVIERINAAKPDLILLPGDYIEDHRTNLAELEPLKFLPSIAPTYAVMGNHDAGKQYHFNGDPIDLPDITPAIKELLRSYGITVLENESLTTTVNDRTITIAGTDDLYMESFDLEKTLKNVDDHPVLLLSHNPDVILNPLSKKADLIVCGHTHGGQVRLPLIGSLAPIPDQLGRKYDQGIFQVHDGLTTLVISHGIGESVVRARLFCVPEIMVLKVSRRLSLSGKSSESDG